jgi:hypothetical protein
MQAWIEKPMKRDVFSSSSFSSFSSSPAFIFLNIFLICLTKIAQTVPIAYRKSATSDSHS